MDSWKVWGYSSHFTRVALGQTPRTRSPALSLSVVGHLGLRPGRRRPPAQFLPRAPPAGKPPRPWEAAPQPHEATTPPTTKTPHWKALNHTRRAGIAVTGLTHTLLPSPSPHPNPPLPRRLGTGPPRANLIRTAVAHGGRARVGGVGRQPLLPCHGRPAR